MQGACLTNYPIPLVFALVIISAKSENRLLNVKGLTQRYLQGKIAQAEIDQRIAHAISTASVVRLGSQEGQEQGFGQCLLIQAGDDSSLSGIRSQLGNTLAAESGKKGLRSIGLIAYREVEPLCTDLAMEMIHPGSSEKGNKSDAKRLPHPNETILA